MMARMTREEWAVHHRTLYADEVEGAIVSEALVDYATREEVAAWIAHLKAEWRALTVPLQQANQALLAQRQRLGLKPPRTKREAVVEYLEQSQSAIWSELEPFVSAVDALVERRHKLWKTCRDLEEGRLPHFGWGFDVSLAPLRNRYEAARAAEIERLERERAARPVDDAAWAEELAYRAKIDAYLRNGPFVHSI
jgi:hypothetical protein